MTKTHFERIVTRRDFTLTSTLCNRLSNRGEEINSTDKPEEVTCKFCQKLLEKRKAA